MIGPEDIEDRLFFDSGRDTEIIIASQTKSGALIATPVETALTAALIDGKFDVLILDPFVSTHRVSENDNMAIDAVAKTFGRIAENANCAIELIHHVRKTNGAEITAEDGRGASAMVAAARSVRVLNNMSKDEAVKAGIEVDRRRFFFRSDIGKANLAPPSEKAAWYNLASIAARQRRSARRRRHRRRRHDMGMAQCIRGRDDHGPQSRAGRSPQRAMAGKFPSQRLGRDRGRQGAEARS